MNLTSFLRLDIIGPQIHPAVELAETGRRPIAVPDGPARLAERRLLGAQMEEVRWSA